MKRQAWVIGAVAIAIIALVALIITFSTTHRDEKTGAPIAQKESQEAEGPKRAEAKGFEFRRLDVDTSKTNAEACLVFTSALDDTGATRYGDYLSIDPETRIDIRPQGNRLCLAGLDFAASYTVTLRAGLPGAKGAKLNAAETVPVELKDRPPIVAFEGGFILPHASTDGLPVTTVNVDKVEIEVMRVSDKLITQLRAGLVDERSIYGYDRETYKDEQGRLVWHGTMDVKSLRNETVTTLFPLRKALPKRDPGVYLVIARDAAKRKAIGDEYETEWGERAAQWIIDTDLGLTTYRGNGGLDVFVRSLERANPVQGVELALLARDNEELARGTTDRNGAVHFDAGLMRGTGGAEPVLVAAYGSGNDFAYIDLRRASFDLSDRGVSGRASPGPIDAFLYTERGIYRPGETVHFVALLRDREAEAVADAPLTLKVQRPDGMVYRELKAAKLQAGGATLALTLTDTAARGRWSAQAYVDPTGTPVGHVEFDVQDFVPERLKLTLAPTQKSVAPGEPISVGVQARFLYGAPGSGLEGEGDMRLVPADEPFPDFKDYRFGLVDDGFSPGTVTFKIPETDKDGKTTAETTVDPGTDASFPLDAKLHIGLFEPGGRTTSEDTSVPVHTRPFYIGLRGLFENNEVAENAQAKFALVALDRAGKQLDKPGLHYTLVREETDYQWYQVEGEWRFETVTRDHLVNSGTIDAKAGALAELGDRVEWGTYRLTVNDAENTAATSLRFYAGWGAGASESRPDRVAVHADKKSYTIGDNAKISIRAPRSGKALVVIAGDRVFSSRLIDVDEGGTDVRFDVKKEWGSGAYALVTLYRPLDSNNGNARAPVRAIGLVWLGIDAGPRTFSVAIESPDVVRPRTTIDVPVQIANGRPGETLKLALAAVDEGILQLTDYESPKPADYYFGKRRLGVDIRDDYGRLIRPVDAQTGPIREGGDSLGGRALAVVPTRTVSLFSGLVTPDKNGRAVIKLAIPDFVGELRLMAVAFGETRLGQAEKPLTIRDPLVADVTLPRFLAPGDEATATLIMDNVEGASGIYRARLAMSGSLQGTAQTLQANLQKGERKRFGVPVKAGDAGIGTMSLTVEGPAKLNFTRSWPIEIRPAVLPETEEKTAALAPGAEAKIDATALSALRPESASLTLTVAGTKGFDVPSLLKWLDRYPFGCIEQTTSRAFPLVYANKLAKASGLAQDNEIKASVQNAIERVVDMQSYNGGFGMWGALGDPADPWISVFAIDFLSEAKANNYVVPNAALDRAFDWLRGFAARDGEPMTARAYALYVLARAGTAKAGDVRYFYDTGVQKFGDAITPALAGAALAEVGDRARATDGFRRATELARKADPGNYNAHPYGSLLRDVAGVTALLAASGEAQSVPVLMQRTAALEPPIEYTTTQEKAWLVRAASAIEAVRGDVSVEITGGRATKASGMVSLTPTAAELAQGIQIKNTGTKEVWWSTAASGIPQTLPGAQANGISIEKRIFTLEGVPANLAAAKQSDRFIVSIRGVMQENVFRPTAVLDLLPAGFEIEAVVQRLPNGHSPYPFLDELTQTSVAEARDDRFVAAFDLGDRYPDPEGKRKTYDPRYHVAYIVRAVTPGNFVLPAARVEAMYAPQIRATTDPGHLVVVPSR